MGREPSWLCEGDTHIEGLRGDRLEKSGNVIQCGV